MENFIVLRIDKIKSKSQISGRLNHNYRIEENNTSLNNVDLTLSHKNKKLIGSNKEDVYKLFDEKISKQKQRKNAVFGIEFLISASPEWFKNGNLEDFTNTAIDFVKNEIGEDNVISAVLHLDESTPHLQFITLPLKDDKLNFKAFYKNKYDLEKLQDRAGKTFNHLGLSRGISKTVTNAKNKNFRQYQNEVLENKTEITELTEQKSIIEIELEKIVKSLEKPQKDKKSYTQTALEILKNLENLNLKDFVFKKDLFISNIKNLLLKSPVHKELFKLSNELKKQTKEKEELKIELEQVKLTSKNRYRRQNELQEEVKNSKKQNDIYLKYYTFVKNNPDIEKNFNNKNSITKQRQEEEKLIIEDKQETLKTKNRYGL